MTMEETQEVETPTQNAPRELKAKSGRRGMSEETRGFWYTICSALSYTVSLSSLRMLTNYTEVSPDWSIAIKEMTTVAVVTPFILVQTLRGRYRFPKAKTTLLLILAGILCQAFGARPHLLAYAAIGVALATPLVQALQLIYSSLIGAFWLKERVTKYKILALVLLIVAVWLLSAGSDPQNGQIAGRQMRIALGLGCVASTAFGYASQLAIMRRILRSSSSTGDADVRVSGDYAPTSLAMVLVTLMGALICGACFTREHGCAAWLAPPPACWRFVLISGVANMVGFYFQIESLRRLFVLKQTMIANAQTIALTLFGICFLHEPFTWSVALGVLLVAGGVAIASLSK